MKILVSGGHGFLGRYLVREFVENVGAEVAVVSRSVPPKDVGSDAIKTYLMELPSPELRHCLSEFAPDVFVHCAGKASVPESIKDPHGDFFSQVVLTESVLEAVRQVVPQSTFVYLSSAAVYGQPPKLPISEESVCNPMSPYGFHKFMAEILLQKTSILHGLTTISARIFSAYGAGLERQVIWEICNQAVTKKKIRISGTGYEVRDFIHASDAASAVAQLLFHPRSGHSVFNIASGVSHRIMDIAQSVSQLCGGVPVEFEGRSPAGDPLDWRSDVAKICAEGFVSRVPIERGLTEVLQYARQVN